MTPPGSSRRRKAGLILGAAALVSAGLALSAYLTGGFRIHVLGVPLSVRGEFRPALLALLLSLGSLHLLNAWQSRAVAGTARLLPRAAPWMAVAAALCMLTVGVRNLSTVASASDPSGYVSQAWLWLGGDLKARQPDVGPTPWPESEWAFSPLGYRPDAATHTLVPTYAPGLPLLMAAATLVAGVCGPYLISPLCAALLVWGTYAIGSRLSSPAVGLVAAAGVAVSPAVVFMMIQPMSDVPTATFWTLSMLFAAARPAPRNAVLAGAMAGVAIMIRPNMAPLAAIPALLIVVPPDAGDRRTRLIHAVLFAAGCAPCVATVAAVFNHLYGSPLRSGYGSLDQYYALSNAALNLSVYPRSFLDTQGLAAFAFLLTPLVAFLDRDDRRVRRMLCFLFVGAVVGCYLFFLSFEEWWYLRFLLPAFPFVFILGADAVSTLSARIGPVAQSVALIIFAALIVFTGVAESSARHILLESEGERRYADAAAYVQESVPAGAVVLTMQHSGSLAYYSDKLMLRYDRVPAEWIDRVIDSFQRGGRPVYLLLDDWEIPLFAERFRGRGAEALVYRQPLAATVDGRVRLFATDAAGERGLLVEMPRTDGCLPPGVPNLYRRRGE